MEEMAKLIFMLTAFFAVIITMVICVSNKYPSKLCGDSLKAWLERLERKNEKD